jgi:hypothetical protein
MFNENRYLVLKNSYIKDKSKQSLCKLCNYLDNHNIKMPIPLYQYNSKDRKTWFFLEGFHSFNDKTGEYSYKEVRNLEFAYMNLVNL